MEDNNFGFWGSIVFEINSVEKEAFEILIESERIKYLNKISKIQNSSQSLFSSSFYDHPFQGRT